MTSEKGEPMACPSDLDLFIAHAAGLWLLRDHPAMSYIEVQLGPAEIEVFRAELASLRARLDAMERWRELAREARPYVEEEAAVFVRDSAPNEWLARFDALEGDGEGCYSPSVVSS